MADKMTAVVVDDEKDLTTYLSAILQEHGWSVRVANDAETGESLIRHSPPDLILLDLVMPGRTGIQLFARLRGDESTRSIPLIMVTGIKEQFNIDWRETVTKLKARVPDGFIEKPVQPERLMKLVNDVMTHRERGLQLG